MANQRKKLEFESSFGDRSRSPKRPKLEVIQRPSTSTARNESSENVNEDDDLWGDELGDDVVEEALLLESQASTLKVQPPKPQSCQNVASGVFKPKTAIISSSRHTFVSSKDPIPGNILKDRGSDTVKETVVPGSRVFNSPVPVLSATQPLRVEKVKSNVIGKGFGRSYSSPSFAFPRSSSIASAKPVSEVKDSSRKKGFISSAESENQPAGSSNETEGDQDERCKILKTELEKLKLEAFSNTGEAALLRQKLKDAALELEKEKLEREKMIEKINQKHLEEVAALKRQLEAAKAELEFKDRDVGNVVEKCKLLEAGNIVVRPVELKGQSPAASCSSSNIQNRSMLEHEFKRKINIGSKKTHETTRQRPEEHEPERKEDWESYTRKDKFDKPLKFKIPNRISDGRLLCNLIVPYWFENAAGVTEELFESKWEGVAAVSALINQDSFKSHNLDQLIKWLWSRTLKFLSILRKRSEDDYKFHELRAANLKKYREWCLDRRIPLPQERETKNEYCEEDWFCNFAEQSLDDPLKWLLNYRPWCPKEVFPEIRRTIALCIALMEVSRRTAAIFATHNSCKGYDYCNQCGAAYDCVEPDYDDSESANDTDDEVDREFNRLYREALNRSPPCKNELLHRFGPENGQDPSSSNKVPETSKEISSKDDHNLASNSKVPETEEINSKNDQNPSISSELCKASVCTGSKKNKKPVIEDDDSSSDSSQLSETEREFYEKRRRAIIEIPDDKFLEVDADTSDILEYDFVHLVHQICKTIGGMKRFSPFEGILGAVLTFLNRISDGVEWSYRGMLLVSAVIKEVLFIRPRLRILIHLLDLLVSTGIHPLIMQRLCVNSAWNSAYKDRWKSVWMFTPKVCPLQVLLVVMENVTRRKDLKDCSKVLWLEYRTRVFLTFNEWLHSVTEQPGHLVDWLCYALHDDSDEETSEDEASVPRRKKKSGSNAKRKDVADTGKGSEKGDDAKGVKESEKDENAGEHEKEREKDDVAERMKEPEKKENGSDSATAKETVEREEENVEAEAKKMETEEVHKEEDDDDIPIKTVYESSSDSLMDSDDDRNIEIKEGPDKRCCCRRWLINVLVYILSSVFSDYQEIIQADPSVLDCMSYIKKFIWKKDEVNPITTLYDTYKGILQIESFISDQSECLQLGIFMLRELLRRGHPELSIPAGKGFLWHHYTVKGTILHNGQIVTKDYTYKSVPGGPISGAYGSLIRDVELEVKYRKMKFRESAVKALDELLEARNSWQAELSPVEPDEDEEYWWDMIEKVTCVRPQLSHDDPEIDRQYHISLAKELNIDLSTRVFF